jgi:hypothetical protein
MALTVNKSGGQFQNSRLIWRIEALKVGAWRLAEMASSVNIYGTS